MIHFDFFAIIILSAMQAINEDEGETPLQLPSYPSSIKKKTRNYDAASLASKSNHIGSNAGLAMAFLSDASSGENASASISKAGIKSPDIKSKEFSLPYLQTHSSNINLSISSNPSNPFQAPASSLGKKSNSNESLKSNDVLNGKPKSSSTGISSSSNSMGRRAEKILSSNESLESNDILHGNPKSRFNSSGLLSSSNSTHRVGRRASIIPSARRGSLIPGGPLKQVFDEDQLKYFWSNRGITLQDIEVAFNFLSQDKHKLTHSDIKQFVSTYFDSFPEEAMSVLSSWKEEVTINQLEDVLLSRPLITSPYESAFKVSHS